MINYVIFTQFYEKILKNNNYKLLRDCRLFLFDKCINLSGYIDTGNFLKDKNSGKNIVIVNALLIQKHIKKNQMTMSEFLNKIGYKKLNYSTVSGDSYLYIFKPQNFTVEDKNLDCYVGINFNNTFSNFDCLLDSSCL